MDRFDDNIAAIVTNSAKRSGLTFAPEAGTQARGLGARAGACAACAGGGKVGAGRSCCVSWVLNSPPARHCRDAQRLRDIINKGLTNEELLRGVKTAWDKGWRQIKLYFMM